MMTIAAKIKHCLEQHKVPYQIFHHSRTATLPETARLLDIPESNFIRAIILADQAGLLLLVLPLNRQIDFERLKKVTGRPALRILSRQEMDKLYPDCEPCAHVPLGMPYGLPMILDRSLLNTKELYFEAGSHTSLVRLSQEDFRFINSSCLWGEFSAPRQSEPGFSAANIQSECVWKKIEQFYALPDCPKLDKRCPLLLQAAIDELFDIEESGCLGREAIWTHAKLSADLTGEIATQLPTELGVDPELAYFAAWMQNVGFLVFSHLFKPEFKTLNRLFRLYPTLSIQSLERKLLGMGHAQHIVGQGHTQMGAWLLGRWGMPHEVVTVAAFHHDNQYQNTAWPYARTVYLANQLLSLQGTRIGDIASKMSVKSLDLGSLGLNIEQLKPVSYALL